MDSKIFVIGFNKCGTTTIHNYFRSNSIPSVHWCTNGIFGNVSNIIHRNDKNKKKLLDGIDNYKVYSDMEYVSLFGKISYANERYFKKLDEQYPNSKFIFNTRNIDNWIRSRNNHLNSLYSRILMLKTGLSKIELNNKWRQDYYKHFNNVVNYFSNKPNKLLIFNIEKDSPKKINIFLKDLKLDESKYIIKNKTK